jgi:hypothetical protein
MILGNVLSISYSILKISRDFQKKIARSRIVFDTNLEMVHQS